jgi:hypothetical protein
MAVDTLRQCQQLGIAGAEQRALQSVRQRQVVAVRHQHVEHRHEVVDLDYVGQAQLLGRDAWHMQRVQRFADPGQRDAPARQHDHVAGRDTLA